MWQSVGRNGQRVARMRNLTVVPAHAGTHTPRSCVLARWLTPFAPMDSGDYGSLRSQGRRIVWRVRIIRYTSAFPRRERPSLALVFRPTEGVGNAGCPPHP